MKLSIKVSLVLLLAYYKVVYGGEFIQYGGQTYYIAYPQIYNWFESYRYCAAHGMFLIDMRTEAEYNRIMVMTKEYHKKNNESGGPYWTSGMKLGGTFYWLTTGRSLEYRNWLSGHPKKENNLTISAGNICLAMSGFVYNKYKIFDNDCSQPRSFICRDTLDVPIYKSDRCLVPMESYA